MGAFNSIHEKLKEFSDMDEENEADHSTPQKVLRHKCLTNIDPRSPTENIDRTPIIVEGTPNVQLSKVMKSRIISENGPIDPRSPSAEFARTPLSFGQASSMSSTSDTPLKAHFMPSQVLKQSNISTIRNKPPQERLLPDEQLFDVLDQSISSTDIGNVFTTEDSLGGSFDTAPLLEATEKIELSLNQETKKSCSSVGSEVETETEDSFSSQSKLRCRPVNRILKQNTSSPAKVRSPLALVENSSRVSQMSKKVVTTSRGKTDLFIHNDSVVIDKENVCH